MRIYLIHGKQRLEWLWVFQPRFLSWNAGITADLNPPRIFDPPVQIRWRIWTPLRRFGPPTKLSF